MGGLVAKAAAMALAEEGSGKPCPVANMQFAQAYWNLYVPACKGSCSWRRRYML